MTRKLLAVLCLAALFLNLAACVRPVMSDIKVTPLPTALLGSPTLPSPSPTPTSAPIIGPVLPTATLQPTTPTSNAAGAPREYAVVFISQGGLLNVRSSPGTDSAILETLAPQATGLVGTGNEQEVSGARWVEIQRADSSTGWVTADYITEQEDATPFCGDGRVTTLLDRLIAAVNGQDGKALASLVSPAHGLTIQYSAASPAVTIALRDELGQLFTSSTSYDWGQDSASGQEIDGTFKDIVQPRLSNVTAATPTRHCNVLQSGTSAGSSTAPLDWPYEYVNFNFVALYRPALAGQEQDWRTWAVGIEYVNGAPYIVVLVQYNWEG